MAFEPKPFMVTPVSTRHRIEQCWRALVRRNQWSLVDEEDAWIEQVSANLPDEAALTEQQIKTILYRAYSARLYRSLQNREDRAVYELWWSCFRVAIRKTWLWRGDAEEVAQETMARVLEKLSLLRDPQALISWTHKILRTVLQDHRGRLVVEQRIELSLDAIDISFVDVEDPAETPTDAVEQKVVTEELLSLLEAKIPNGLERTTILRQLLFGDHPRDIARDMSLPLHRTRIAKYRVLARLRDDEEFMRVLAELSDCG